MGGSPFLRPHSFVGRETELAELQTVVDSGERLVSIVAPGGYGKSRLVSRFVEQAAPGFRDGTAEILLANLSDPERIAVAAAYALGLQLHGDQDPEKQLFDFLRKRQVLLHFDNFEHLLEGAAFIAQLLQHVPKATVLVSSREPLGLSGERVVWLKPLPTVSASGAWDQLTFSAASRLFADRAALVDQQFVLDDQNAQAVETICSDLEGVPLAIELAAAWVDQYDLAELHRGLHFQIDLAARSDDVPERHRSVRASCDWSYALLNESQRLLLRAASVFSGGFFLDAAREILPLPDLAGELAALVAKSWLRTTELLGQTRFEMHNSAIREYAFQHLLDTPDYEPAVLSHCRYFGQLLADQAGALKSPRQIEATWSIALELDNVLDATRTAVARGEADLLAPLAEHLHEYLLLVGGARQCLARYREILAAGKANGDQHIIIQSLLALAAASVQTGDYKAARALATEASSIPGGHTHLASSARAAGILALVEKYEGNHDEARYQYNLALSRLRELDDTHGIATVLQGLGQVEMVESDYDTARRLIRESAELRRTAGDAHGVAACLNDLGNMEYRQGHFAEARALHSESLELRRSIGDRRGIGQSLSNLGNVEFSECDYGAAWSLYRESLDIRREIGERFGMAASLNNLGNVQYCEGNFDEARKLHEEGLSIKREIGDRIGASYSLNNLGNISIQLGNLGQARSQLGEALLIARELSSSECIIAALANCCCLLARNGAARPARLLYWAVHHLLDQEGLVLDQMDGGTHEEGGRLALGTLGSSEEDEIRADANRMSLDEAVSLALKEI